MPDITFLAKKSRTCREKDTITNCPTPIGYLPTAKGLKHLPCGRWGCWHCGYVKKNRLIDQVAIFFEGEELLRFMTLTKRSTDTKPIMKYWIALRKRLLRKFPGFKAFWTKETTKRGVEHLHFIINRFIDKSWLKATWEQITKGTSFMVDISLIEGNIKSASGYMMKYLTKQLYGGDYFKKHTRRTGFVGGKAPVLDTDWEKDEEIGEPIIEQHFNPDSKIWLTWYDYYNRLIGVPFIEYINAMTLSSINQNKMRQQRNQYD